MYFHAWPGAVLQAFVVKAFPVQICTNLCLLIKVKVTLADSPQFTAQPCRGCTYTQCVCSEESKTFQWTVAPSELGKPDALTSAWAVIVSQICLLLQVFTIVCVCVFYRKGEYYSAHWGGAEQSTVWQWSGDIARQRQNWYCDAERSGGGTWLYVTVCELSETMWLTLQHQ